MKNKQPDKLMQILTKTLVVLFGLFLFYLMAFILEKSDTGDIPSNIPVFDQTSLKTVLVELEEREDSETQGKPNTGRFNFGNSEPF